MLYFQTRPYCMTIHGLVWSSPILVCNEIFFNEMGVLQHTLQYGNHFQFGAQIRLIFSFRFKSLHQFSFNIDRISENVILSVNVWMSIWCIKYIFRSITLIFTGFIFLKTKRNEKFRIHVWKWKLPLLQWSLKILRMTFTHKVFITDVHLVQC